MNQRFENDEEMLTRGLQALASEMKDLEAPEHVEVKLLEAFRARKVVVPISTRRWTSGRYWLAAVAAVLLIAMSVVALRWRSAEKPAESFAERREPEMPKVNPSREETPKPVEYQAVIQPPLRYNPKRIRHPRSRSSENAQVASLRPSEIATDFIPLRYMNVANLQEGGQIVRVEVPRSALANFGLPVNMDRYNERVKADVLYGVDGLAHAIRFVK
jgi:hypothetical protein